MKKFFECLLVLSVFSFLSCQQKISKQERLDYFVMISYQIKDIEKDMGAFEKELLETKLANDRMSSAAPAGDRFIDLNNQLITLQGKVNHRLSIFEKLDTPPYDCEIKDQAIRVLANVKGILDNELPWIINGIKESSIPASQNLRKEELSQMRQQLKEDYAKFKVFSMLYKETYQITAADLEKYALK